MHAPEADWLAREQAAGRIRGDITHEALFSFLHTMLNGLVLARTSGVELDVEPIVTLVRETLEPR